MIKIIAKSTVKEGKIAEFKETASELINKSKQESGCISYDLFQDINNANILTFIEEWKDEDAIKFHNNSEHFTTIVPKLEEFREGSPEVNLYILAE